jgi:hypothetical protein
MKECDKYEIIFKGKITSVKTCKDKPGEAVFELEELYKGNSANKFTVLYECEVPCAMNLNVGEEWIIYGNYKQIDNARLDWCSRSRKYFKNDNEDFYTVTHGNDYYDEVEFLRNNFGSHRFTQAKTSQNQGHNQLPTTTQTIILVICSLLVIVLFYWLFGRFFKF